MGGSGFDAGGSSGEAGSSTGGSGGEAGSTGGSGGESGTAGAAGTSFGGAGGEAGAGVAGASGASGTGGTGGSTGGIGGGSVVYEANVNGTPIGSFSLIVGQVTPSGQSFRFWLNGARASFRLTLALSVAMGTTQGDYSCGSSGTTSLSISYLSPATGVEYATPPIAQMGSCAVHFTHIPATGTGRFAGTFSGTLAFHQPPFDAPGPWDMTPVSITDGVFDLQVPAEHRR